MDSGYLFCDLVNLETIQGVETIDTSKVIYINYMFAEVGNKSKNITLDLSNFSAASDANLNGILFETNSLSESNLKTNTEFAKVLENYTASAYLNNQDN